MTKLTRGALAITMLSTMSMAQNDFYVGVGTAMEIIDSDLIDDMGTAIEVKVGKVFTNKFGIEAKITKTILEAEDSRNIQWGNGTFNTDIKSDISTYSLVGTYQHQLTPEIMIIPKIGYLKGENKMTYSAGNTKSTETNSVTKLVFGIDVKKDFPQYGFNIYAGYTKVAKDVSHLSFGIEKSF